MEGAKKHILESTQQIVDLYCNNVYRHGAIRLMKDRNTSSKLVNAIYDQLTMKYPNLTMGRFHYYAIPSKNRSHKIVGKWTSRYMLASNTKPAFHEIQIIDLFHDKSIVVKVEKSADNVRNIYPLKDGFGLLEENEYPNSYISLIWLDIYQRSLKKLHTIEYSSNWIQIFVDKADSAMFMLKDFTNNVSRIGKIVDKKLIIGDVIDINFSPDCFYNKCIYILNMDGEQNEDHYPQQISRMTIYDVEKKRETRFELEAPVGYTIYKERSVECVRGNLFLYLKRENNDYVIGCMNIQTHRWNILEFSLNVRGSITGFEEGDLIIHTQSGNSRRCHLYKIPFGNPDSLESTVWLSLVNTMKNRDIFGNRYEAARKYLLPNSAINCPFYRPRMKKEVKPSRKRKNVK